jgi:purine-binding chemotaxis protein CheW
MTTATMAREISKGGSVSSSGGVERDPLCQYLTFSLWGESFAIPIEHVREIIEFGGITTIPMMPPFLRGVINLRGAVVPVVDVQARFGRGETNIAKRTCVVIVEVLVQESPHMLGVLVDSVSEVLTLDRSRLEAKPSFGSGIRSDFVEGILNLEDRFIVTLDIDKVLSVEEMAALVGASSSGRPEDPA